MPARTQCSLFEFGSIVSPVRSCFSLCIQKTGASIHVERVIAAAVLICILSSACEMSQMEYGHTGNFPVVCWCHSVFQEVFDVAWKLENTVPPVIVLSSTHLPRRDADQGMQFWINRVDQL